MSITPERDRMLFIDQQIKSLTMEKLSYMKKLSDPNKTKQLYNSGKKLYQSILDTEITKENSILSFGSFIKNAIQFLTDEERIYFTNFKNDNCFFQQKLFKEFEKHPCQIILEKHHSLGKRKVLGITIIKQQQSLNKVLKSVWSAKIDYYMVNRMRELEEIEKQQKTRSQDGESFDFDLRKKEVSALLKSGTKQKVIAEKVGVSLSTVKRLIKKIKSD